MNPDLTRMKLGDRVPLLRFRRLSLRLGAFARVYFPISLDLFWLKDDSLEAAASLAKTHPPFIRLGAAVLRRIARGVAIGSLTFYRPPHFETRGVAA